MENFERRLRVERLGRYDSHAILCFSRRPYPSLVYLRGRLSVLRAVNLREVGPRQPSDSSWQVNRKPLPRNAHRRESMTDGPLAAPPEACVPGLPLPSTVTERFLEAGGVKFRYLQGGTTSGLPVVLLHGWPTWAEVWLPVAWVLGARHPWIAPDLPCQGRSSPLPGKVRTLTAYRNAIAAFVDALDLPRFAVVGNSMGGTLAVMIALDRPARVAKVVVLDAAGLTPKLPGKTARMYLPFLLPCFVRAPGPKSVRKLLTKAVFHDPRFADGAWVDAIVAAWGPRDRRRAFMATGFALRRRDASVSANLGNILAPTLILSGRHDVQFPWESAEEAARRIPGSRFAAIEDAGHFPMVEKPRETAQLISEFLHTSG